MSTVSGNNEHQEQWRVKSFPNNVFMCLARIHNIIAKAALKFGSEAWVLKKREKQCLEAAQMKFLRHLLGITKLDKENTNVLGKKQEQRI